MAGLNMWVVFLLCGSSLMSGKNATCYFENNFENIYLCRQCAILKCDSPTADEILEAMINVNLSGIQKIQMTENNITVLSEDTFYFDKLSGIKEFDLSKNNIMELPDNIFNSHALVNLETLTLENNKLVYLHSDQFSFLSGLKFFNFGGNKIQTVEGEVFTSISNSSLQEIDLSENEITELPEDLFKTLTNLSACGCGAIVSLKYRCVRLPPFMWKKFTLLVITLHKFHLYQRQSHQN